MSRKMLDRAAKSDPNDSAVKKPARYVPPRDVQAIRLADLMDYCGRKIGPAQKSLFAGQDDQETNIFFAGDLALLKLKCVSVIGARDVSAEGARRARKVADSLADAGVVITSGLARGVDVEAHYGAISNGGSTVAVIGTPIEKSYPAEHARIQEKIYRDHLLISQFPKGCRTFPSDFPRRNRLMAALTDASIIVEASDSSGTLHQAAECVRLGRWLFIMKSVADRDDLDWPKKFLKENRVVVLNEFADVLERIL